MKVQHIFNDHLYVISNHVVACNSIFNSPLLCSRFLEKIDLYLSPLCKVLQYIIHENQFQLIVKISSRKDFEEYYRKKKGEELDDESIPFSTHIFSQAMANLQASAAIHFNRKFGRTGAIFARRFSKELITSKDNLDKWMLKMKKCRRLHRYGSNWGPGKQRKQKRGDRRLYGMKWERSGLFYYKNWEAKHAVLRNFVRIQNLDLQGQFKKIPPASIYTQYFTLKNKKFMKISSFPP